ncbi:MAG TPA: hypothetical protein VFQ34_00605 [Nitrospiraceae bacterium]|nr:hypothetical protein [Nitrospiraceae bacterium]
MTTADHRFSSRVRWLVRLGYWSALLGGLTLPWILMLGFDHFVRNVPWRLAWRSFYLHLFAPGYNFFLIGLLNVVSFVLLAIIILFHLGKAPLSDPPKVRQRAWALATAGLTMIGVSAWTHVSVLIHPDAQGGLVYFFLPVTLFICLSAGYAAGWLAAKWLRHGAHRHET